MTGSVVTEEKIYKSEIQDQIRLLVLKGEMTQTSLAKNIGCSPTTISQYLQSGYPGDVEKLEKNIEQFLRRNQDKKSYKITKLDYCDTTIAEKILNIASMTHYNCDISVCVGKSGIGKTTAINAYANKIGGVIVIDPDEVASPRFLLKQIADIIKLPQIKQATEDVIADIIYRIKDTNTLIIIDEAENLNDRAFRVLRKIHDRCENTCGLLFIGTQKLHANLLKMKGEFEYVVNRIARFEVLTELTSKDIGLFVKQIFPEADPETIKYFEEITDKNARILYNTLKTARDFVNSGMELNKKTILSAKPGIL